MVLLGWLTSLALLAGSCSVGAQSVELSGQLADPVGAVADADDFDAATEAASDAVEPAIDESDPSADPAAPDPENGGAGERSSGPDEDSDNDSTEANGSEPDNEAELDDTASLDDAASGSLEDDDDDGNTVAVVVVASATIPAGTEVSALLKDPHTFLEPVVVEGSLIPNNALLAVHDLAQYAGMIVAENVQFGDPVEVGVFVDPDDYVSPEQILAAELGEVIIEGEPLPLLGQDRSEPDPAAGTTAPVITATAVSTGEPTIIGPGTSRIIGFFAHWCPHCQRELPEVREWLETNPLPPGIEFVAVSTAVDQTRSNFPPSAWFENEQWNETTILDDAEQTILRAYGIPAFPAFVVTDSHGTVAFRHTGVIGAEGLEQLVTFMVSQADE